MLDLPKTYSWDFLLAILGFLQKGKGHQICLQNKPDSKYWGNLLYFCSCEALHGITMLNALDEEVRPKRSCLRSQMVWGRAQTSPRVSWFPISCYFPTILSAFTSWNNLPIPGWFFLFSILKYFFLIKLFPPGTEDCQVRPSLSTESCTLECWPESIKNGALVKWSYVVNNMHLDVGFLCLPTGVGVRTSGGGRRGERRRWTLLYIYMAGIIWRLQTQELWAGNIVFTAKMHWVIASSSCSAVQIL